MPRGHDLSDFERGQIYALKFLAGWTCKEIAGAIVINYDAVKKYCQRVPEKQASNTSLSTDRKGKCGRDRCTTQRDDRVMCRTALGDRFLTATAIKRQHDDINCCVRTVRRRLNDSGLLSRTPAPKSLLSLVHKRNRLTWSIEHLNWTQQQWQTVIFSDESKFVIQQHHVRYVRRRVGERYLDSCIEGRGNRGLGEIMIWAAFSFHGHSDIVLMDKRYNANDYIQLLQQHLLPRINHLLPHGGLFMQDNAPIHRANATIAFLRQANIRLLPWPAVSPDMNPIENLWAICKAQLVNYVVHTRQQLLEAVITIWNEKMNDNNLRSNLINSMPRRVRLLHIARGGYTRY